MDALQNMQQNYALLAEDLENISKRLDALKRECDRLVMVCQCGADPRNAIDDDDDGDEVNKSSDCALEVPDDWDWVHGVHPTSRSQQ